MTMRGAWQEVLQNSGARLYWMLVGVGSTFITARYLGPEGRGILAAAVTWVSLFTTAAHLSLPNVLMFFTAGRRKEEWLPAMVGTLLALVAAVTLISWIVALSLAAWPSAHVFGRLPGHVVLVAFAALPFLLGLENGNSLLIALGKLRGLNLALIAGGTVNIVLIFLFVGVLHLGAAAALVAILIAQTTACGIEFGLILKDAGRPRWERPLAFKILVAGARLHLNTIGTFLALQSGVLILNHFRTSAETAYYHLALQMTAAIQVIPFSVSTVAYSIVSREGVDAGWRPQRRLVMQVVAAVSVISLAAYLMAPLAVRILAGPAFLPAVSVFRTLLLGTVGMSLSLVMACQWISRGFFLRVAMLSLAGGLITVGANWLIIPRYGMQGAAWVMVAMCGVSMLVNGSMIVWVERRWRRLQAVTPTRS
jgi:O-antigen/teichoic acid export membrane protein